MPAEMVALTSYQPFPEKSNGPENMILVYICEYTLKIFIFVEIYSGIFQTYADVYASFACIFPRFVLFFFH